MRTHAIEDCRYCPDPNRVAATSGAIVLNAIALLALMIPISAIEIPKLVRVERQPDKLDVRIIPPDQVVVVPAVSPPPVRPTTHERSRVELPVAPSVPIVTEQPSSDPLVPQATDTFEPVGPPAMPMVGPTDIRIACIVCVKPTYPRSELIHGVQGETVVWLRIDREGMPANVRVEHSSGNPNLDRAALDAVRKWRFAPAIQAGGAVEVEATVPVKFSIFSG